MEALLAAELPDSHGWQYEPKWDGFRCLGRRDEDRVDLISKSGKPLGRYFPEIERMLLAISEAQFLIDGELILPAGDVLSFDALQLRLHPAASRVERLSKETPAQYMLFDMLEIGGSPIAGAPLSERRTQLESFHAKHGSDSLLLSPVTRDRDAALDWLRRSGGALDGVIAKRLDQPYRFGERAMIKVKQRRTADCVVGGFRYATNSKQVGSLLLGLFDKEGKLDHVGFTSGISDEERPALTRKVEALKGGPGFTGDAPGGPSRWSTERSAQWVPLKLKLVAEVQYDHVSGDRFRHGTRFVRWRPDKRPQDCTFAQLQQEARPSRLFAAKKRRTTRRRAAL
jgi:ATP-dependent DNA ligase